MQKTLSALKLLTGRGAVKSLVRACNAGRLVGGLSISLRATADEVVGPLVFAMGGAARRFRVLDVRTGTPLVLEVRFDQLVEKWEVEGVEGFVHNLNDLFRNEPDVKAVAVLGEWEDMLQLWCVPKDVLPKLLDARVLEDARNVRTLASLSGRAD